MTLFELKALEAELMAELTPASKMKLKAEGIDLLGIQERKALGEATKQLAKLNKAKKEYEERCTVLEWQKLLLESSETKDADTARALKLVRGSK
ncbi:MAG: hypothetical protein NVS1B10_05770 [Candidatus Saccharimonadales bacterium]